MEIQEQTSNYGWNDVILSSWALSVPLIIFICFEISTYTGESRKKSAWIWSFIGDQNLLHVTNILDLSLVLWMHSKFFKPDFIIYGILYSIIGNNVWPYQWRQFKSPSLFHSSDLQNFLFINSWMPQILMPIPEAWWKYRMTILWYSVFMISVIHPACVTEIESFSRWMIWIKLQK